MNRAHLLSSSGYGLAVIRMMSSIDESIEEVVGHVVT